MKNSANADSESLARLKEHVAQVRASGRRVTPDEMTELMIRFFGAERAAPFFKQVKLVSRPLDGSAVPGALVADIREEAQELSNEIQGLDERIEALLARGRRKA